MAQQSNPFYIRPHAGGSAQTTQALGLGMQKMLGDGNKRTQQAAMQEEVQAVMERGDASEIAQLSLKYPQIAQGIKLNLGIQSEQQEKEAISFSRDIVTGAGDQSMKFENRIRQLSEQGRDPTNTIESYEDYRKNPGAEQKAIESVWASLDNKGYEAFRKMRGGGIDVDFLKEERASATSNIKALKKRASTIASSINKIKGLVPAIKKGGGSGRTAAGAAIMSLARLVSPGVVTEGDFKAMAGAADPVATIMERMSGREGAEPFLEQLQKAYDPTNPNLIDADGLVAIAESIVGAEAPSVLEEYEEADSRARRSGMNERQYKTIFGDSGSITGLSQYVAAPPVNKQGWGLQMDAAGNRAYVGPNGEIEEVK